MNAEIESQLLSRIDVMERAMFGMNTVDVRRLACEMAARMNIDETTFNKETRLAGPTG